MRLISNWAQLQHVVKTANNLSVILDYRVTRMMMSDLARDFWVVELGGELVKLSKPIQKRLVRQKIAKEYPYPIKNPTQKRNVWDTYFENTEQLSHPGVVAVGEDPPVAVWRVVVKKPDGASA